MADPLPTPVCPFCHHEMPEYQQNNTWRFFRCRTDGYWTSRQLDMGWPSYDYQDAPDFRQEECDWDTIVAQARKIMEHKFGLVGMSSGRFLDIGCSEGAYVAGAASLGWLAMGLEVDVAKVARANARQIDLRSDDITAASTAVPEADFVMLRHVLEHVPDFVGFLCAAARRLAPGGVLWIECPNQSSLSALVSRSKIRSGRYLGALYPPTHIHAFEPRAFQLLRNFVDLRCERLITYSSGELRWHPPSQTSESGMKKLLQRCAAAVGCGTDMAVAYRRV